MPRYAKKEDKDKEEEREPLAERLLKSRTILLSRPVDDKLVESVAAQLFLMQEDSDKNPVYVYINSPGGSVDSGFAIYDLLTFISPPVVTVCNGICASAAVLIFLGGRRGCRLSLPHSRFLLHQPSTSAQGSASDLEITANEILKLRSRYNQIVAAEAGKTVAQVTEDASRDFWMDPEAAQAYGLVNRVARHREDVLSAAAAVTTATGAGG